MSIKRFSDKTGLEIQPDDVEELNFRISVRFESKGIEFINEELERTWHFQKTETAEYAARIKAYTKDLRARTVQFLTEMQSS